MKRKIILSVFAFIVLFTLTGCGSNKETSKTEVKTNNNSVVLYFSATGTTKKIAERISKKLNSDIIEIIPKAEYKEEDLDYNSDCRANREQNDSSARPEIKNKIDISKYDTVYLGYPIWWGMNPKIILTLLDSYDFTGKTIIPFCTSGSTDISGSVEALRKYNPKLNIKDGKRFSANSSESEIIDFIDRNEIDKETSNKEISKMKVTIDCKEYTLNLENNDAAKRLVQLAPLEVTMEELNGNEKYIYLSSNFPVDSYKPGNIKQGDVMLFDTSCLVIFYKTFDTPYSYTKTGHIDNLPNLGSSNVSVKFESE